MARIKLLLREMINPLKTATDGYLKRTTKAVLVIAVAGYLNFGGTPPPNPSNVGHSILEQNGGSGGNKEAKEKEELEFQNNLVIAICKIYIECQI